MASSNGGMSSPFEQIPKVVNKKNYYTFVIPAFSFPYLYSLLSGPHSAPAKYHSALLPCLLFVIVCCFPDMIKCRKESTNATSGRMGIIGTLGFLSRNMADLVLSATETF
jgi:hypothetical protein